MVYTLPSARSFGWMMHLVPRLECDSDPYRGSRVPVSLGVSNHSGDSDCPYTRAPKPGGLVYIGPLIVKY